MQENADAVKDRMAHYPQFLLCDTTGNLTERISTDKAWVASPIRCLDRAIDRRPKIIMIRFGKVTIRERDALVELIGVLKQNSHTRDIPVLALLNSKHRGLLEDLDQAGVDFIKYVGKTALGSTQLQSIIEGVGSDDRVARHLAVLCSFLHYREIDSQHEMTVCGAYLDRMVLGGRRLLELCETEGHLHCEYYLNPRLTS
jgi:hypothetical protein